MTSITPVHRHITPAIARHSSTALCAPSSAAAPSSPARPLSTPKTRETVTIPVQSQDIAIERALLCPQKHISIYLSARQSMRKAKKKAGERKD